MTNGSGLGEPAQSGIAPLIWSIALLGWLAALCLLPDPRPLGAPTWSVQAVQSLTHLSESTARLAATIVQRGVGIGMVGILLTMSLRHVDLWRLAASALLGSPILAVAAKSLNYGYFPIRSQLLFIVVVAVLGALAGLAMRRSRIALVALVVLAAGLFGWGISTGVSRELESAARATGLHLLDNAETISKGDDAFAQMLRMAFTHAHDNRTGADPLLANQAAILALGVILGDDQVVRVGRSELAPDRREERAALRRRATVHGRNDLSQHFWVSAALTVLADEHRALAVGILKELKDSTPGGSGFSFVDMAANKAGIRFAVAATRDAESARAMYERVVGGAASYSFVPDIGGLPEGLSGDDFQREFGGLGGARTRHIMADIDSRLDACQGFQ